MWYDDFKERGAQWIMPLRVRAKAITSKLYPLWIMDSVKSEGKIVSSHVRRLVHIPETFTGFVDSAGSLVSATVKSIVNILPWTQIDSAKGEGKVTNAAVRQVVKIVAPEDQITINIESAKADGKVTAATNRRVVVEATLFTDSVTAAGSVTEASVL